MGESFDHRPAGWIRQRRECCIQSIHNHMVVDYPAMSSVDFGVPDFCFLVSKDSRLAPNKLDPFLDFLPTSPAHGSPGPKSKSARSEGGPFFPSHILSPKSFDDVLFLSLNSTLTPHENCPAALLGCWVQSGVHSSKRKSKLIGYATVGGMRRKAYCEPH